MLAKQQLWTPSQDDRYDDFDGNVPSLVPVFDPAFTATPPAVITPALVPIFDSAFAATPSAAITPAIAPIDMAREHGSSDIMTPGAPMPFNSLRNNVDNIYKAISASPEAPKIHEDIDTLGIHDWKSLTAANTWSVRSSKHI
jgi:hypothetical protein